MPTPFALADYLAELSETVAGELRRDRYSRLLYSTDASIYQVEPYAVLIPRTVEDVHAAVELAARYQVPLLPRTGGSSLAGQAVNKALVIDMTRHLDDVLSIDVEARRVRVQPGIVLDELNTQLRPLGLQFGPDPASANRAAVGGIVANNSTGAHSILHGMTADHLAEMTVVLSDGSTAHFSALDPDQLQQACQRQGLEGTIYRRINALVGNETNQATIRENTPRHWRRCGGYNLDRMAEAGGSFLSPPDPGVNLARLVCGSEGTLAVMTDITLDLVAVPERTALALVHYDSLHEALTSVPVILQAGVSAVELLDHLALTLCHEVPEYSRLVRTFAEGNPNCLLIVEFYGESEADLVAKIDRLKDLLRREHVGATTVVAVLDPRQQHNVWAVRKAGLGLLMSIKGDYKPIPFIEDAAVPVENLAEYIGKIEDFCHDLGTQIAYYAHASAGCLHVRPLINSKQASDLAKLPEIQSFAVELLHGYGGALSSEHGDGRARSWMNEHFFGPELYRLYKEVKLAFDPHNLLNPGNIVDAPAMTDHLRFGDTYQAHLPPVHLDFRPDQGLDRAIEMCNGAGECRKLSTGTMCPSFMATRDEEHSTRGRANALRAALSGNLPATEWTSPRMYRVMELCISCKACKAECPSSVDMAKIKFEFLASFHEANGVPLRKQLLAYLPDINRLCSGPLAGLVNSGLRSKPVRYVLEKTLGFSRQRSLPEFARQPFVDWFATRAPNGEPHNDRVVLFNDTFNTYNTPQVAIAATEVLEAAGFAVLLPGHHCCGRPMISAGLMDEARVAARQTIERLAPLAEQEIPIVGLEPSCILTLRDEYPYMLPDDSRVSRIAELTFTFEEFLARAKQEARLDLVFQDESRQLLLHGHCHEKSLVGTAPSREVLSLPSGYQVTEIDSGCCGMAGLFGYELEHQEVSSAMAERRLWPAVREADEESIIVAAGTSCRQQIEHGTGRRALHPAEVLRQSLITDSREVHSAD